jgi:predicted O-methyltransferase YrrM
MKKVVFDVIKNLQKTIDIYWNVGEQTGQFLNLLIKNFNYKKILEIGTSNGYSGIWIAESLSKNNGHLCTIESHKKERFGLATANFKKSKLSKYITQILGHAPEAIPSSPKFFDLILLDATKYEYRDYLKTIIPRTKKNSIIIADNVVSHKKELKEFIKNISTLKNFQSFKLNIGKGLLVAVRID